jgi:hypothetical protein
MLKYFGFLALFGALVALTPAPASAADNARDGVGAVEHDEISSQYYYRRYRYYRPYRYYYRPRYYRPYRYYRYRYYY